MMVTNSIHKDYGLGGRKKIEWLIHKKKYTSERGGESWNWRDRFVPILNSSNRFFDKTWKAEVCAVCQEQRFIPMSKNNPEESKKMPSEWWVKQRYRHHRSRMAVPTLRRQTNGI